jgi:hypothetical protein
MNKIIESTYEGHHLCPFNDHSMACFRGRRPTPETIEGSQRKPQQPAAATCPGSTQNDFRVLQLSHPLGFIRDTATASCFMKDGQVQGLRKLALQFLNREIQNMMHEAGEDARATLDLYKLYL